MNKLLINENPILVLPTLAKKIGLNEALFIQQLHYWLAESKHTYDGYQWVYNTYEGWHGQFPFWSTSTIRRIIGRLEKEGFIISGNYNRFKMDKTKWYRINYEYLEALMNEDAQLSELCHEQTEPRSQTSGQLQPNTGTDTSYRQNDIDSDKATHQLKNNMPKRSVQNKLDKQPNQTNGTQKSDNLSRTSKQTTTNVTKTTNVTHSNISKRSNQNGTDFTSPAIQTETNLANHNYQHDANLTTSSKQAGHNMVASLAPAPSNVTKAIPETTSEITPETTSEKKSVVVNAHAHAEEQDPFTFFEQNGFGSINGYLFEKIQAWCEDASEELVLEAMKIALESGCKSWSYAESILRRWVDKGFQTVHEVRAEQKKYRERLEKKNNKADKQNSRMERDIPKDFILDLNAGEE